MTPPPPDRPRPPGRPLGAGGPGNEQNWRWAVIVLVGLVAAALVLPGLSGHKQSNELTYSDLRRQANEGHVTEATGNNAAGPIPGKLKSGDRLTVDGPHPLPDEDVRLLSDKANAKFDNSQPNFLASMLPLLIPFLLLIGFWVWMSRRAQGQMTGLMSIGRSK